MTTVYPPAPADQGLVRCDTCGRRGWHETGDCPETRCEPWCVDADHRRHDLACWGADHDVNLTMEPGYPHGALLDAVGRFDPPRVGVYSYRREPGWRGCVYLHLYRPSDNEHLDLDDSLHLTADEARQLAAHLIAVADEITVVV
ncbi:hypothetical protein [Mycobacterium attenuatum]|uniref:hypothetical protein n=1 Tax=Mycobacterium attenuatum TaxID=2341086 RepID=UPI000F1CE9A0|nr:hypothetical protein [Mycobacterium attenuatum]VBA62112.1 hypothetical protein LAUMK41_05499 [Mycobacterium attenuatum]